MTRHYGPPPEHEADMSAAVYGDVFARPHYHLDLRVMFVCSGTGSFRAGWTGIEIAGVDEGPGWSDNYVADGWEKVS